MTGARRQFGFAHPYPRRRSPQRSLLSRTGPTQAIRGDNQARLFVCPSFRENRALTCRSVSLHRILLDTGACQRTALGSGPMLPHRPTHRHTGNAEMLPDRLHAGGPRTVRLGHGTIPVGKALGIGVQRLRRPSPLPQRNLLQRLIRTDVPLHRLHQRVRTQVDLALELLPQTRPPDPRADKPSIASHGHAGRLGLQTRKGANRL